MGWWKFIVRRENGHLKNRSQGLAKEVENSIASIKESGSDEGVHYTENVETVKQLKREQKYDEAIEILLRCVDLTEREALNANHQLTSDEKFSILSEVDTNQWGVSPWYYEQLAIIYRKQKKYSEEVAILERYSNQPKAPGGRSHELDDRLIKARALLAKNNS